MKLSKPLSVLILIASVSLLSAARNVTAEGPSQPNQKTQTETAAQQHDAVASPSPTIIDQPSPAPTPKQTAGNTYNYYYPTKESGDSAGAISAFATIGLLIFAGWQTFLVNKTAKAARDAVVATEQYVKLT